MPASWSCPGNAQGGAEAGGRAGLPPLLRRSPGAGSDRCLGGVLAVVWLAPGAGDEREPGAAAPRVSAGGSPPLSRPGSGWATAPLRSRLPRLALCALRTERNFPSRDSEAGVSLLLTRSRSRSGVSG